MGQSELSRWLKAVDVVALICCVVFFCVITRFLAASVQAQGRAELWWPCVIIMWASVVPMVIVFGLAWRIFSEIGHDNSFCEDNARRLRLMGYLACIVLLVYLVCLVVLGLIDFLPGMMLAAVVVVMFGSLFMAVVSLALSHLTAKAAAIKAENDLTV